MDYTHANQPHPHICKDREYIMRCKQLVEAEEKKKKFTSQCLCVSDGEMKKRAEHTHCSIGYNVDNLYTKHRLDWMVQLF